MSAIDALRSAVNCRAVRQDGENVHLTAQAADELLGECDRLTSELAEERKRAAEGVAVMLIELRKVNTDNMALSVRHLEDQAALASLLDALADMVRMHCTSERFGVFVGNCQFHERAIKALVAHERMTIHSGGGEVWARFKEAGK